MRYNFSEGVLGEGVFSEGVLGECVFSEGVLRTGLTTFTIKSIT